MKVSDQTHWVMKFIMKHPLGNILSVNQKQCDIVIKITANPANTQRILQVSFSCLKMQSIYISGSQPVVVVDDVQ